MGGNGDDRWLGQLRPRGNRAAVALAVGISLILTLLVFATARRMQQRAIAATLAADAGDRAAAVEHRFAELRRMAVALQGFYAASNEVDADEFRTFVAPYLAEAPGVAAVAWLPRVAAAERGAFEASSGPTGDGAFAIVELATGGIPRPAAERAEYFPIRFLESAAGERGDRGRNLGLDLAADAEVDSRIRVARDTGEPLAVGPAALGAPEAPNDHFLLLVPLYTKGVMPTTPAERRERFLGVAAIEISATLLLDGAFRDFAARGVNVRLVQADASPGERVGARYVSPLDLVDGARGAPSERPLLDPLRRVVRFRSLGREWTVVCEPAAGRPVEHALLAWVTLAVGLAFTGALAAYLILSLRHHARVVAAHENLRAANAELARALVERSRLEAENAAIISAAEDAIITADGRGVILSWNRAAERMFGYSADKAVGADLLDLIVPSHYRQRKREMLAQFRRTGEGAALGKTLELSALRKDGSEFPIALSLSSYARNDGFVAVAVVRDISEQHAARAALERRTEELNSRVKELNCLSSVLRLLADQELPLDVLLSRIADLIPTAMRHPEIACCRLVVGETEANTANFARTRWRWSMPIRFHGARIGSCEVCYVAEPPGPGEPFPKPQHELLATVVEQLGKAVEQRRAQSDLRSLKQQIEFILGATKTGLDLFDAEFNLLYVDPVWQQHYGPYVGKKCYEYFADRSEPCPDCPGVEALRTRQPVVREVALPKENNRPVQVTSLPYQDERGRWLVAEVNVDLTERKRLERQAAEARRLESIGYLAAGIAHEINTPIQFIGDNLRFLAEAFDDLGAIAAAARRLAGSEAGPAGRSAPPSPRAIEVSAPVPGDARSTSSAPPPDPAALAALLGALARADIDFLVEEVPNAVAQSREGVERVAGIVRAMKEFAQPGATEKKPMDLNRIVENVLLVSRNEWKRVADARTEFDPELPPVPCLPGELNQALLDLVVNAAEAVKGAADRGLRAKGTITLRTRRVRNWAEIEIEDTGVGIPETLRDRIFDPFFTTKEVGQGTGAGLPRVHSVVVDRHGGSLTFESRPGEGTKFLVRLPLEGAAEPPGAAPPIGPDIAASVAANTSAPAGVPSTPLQPDALATP